MLTLSRRRSAELATALSLAYLVLTAVSAEAATFYVDPVAGSPSGDGSEGNPWQTLDQVIDSGLLESQTPTGDPRNPGAPVKAGDTLLLRSGYHGDIAINGYHNADTVTVAAEPGHTPQLRRMRLDNCRNWTFDGLTISPELAPTFDVTTQVYITSSSSYITVQNCHCYSVDDISTFDATQWISNTSNGITIRAGCHHISVLDNTIRNTAFGINLSGTDLLCRGNQIINFRGDGIRATNHNQTIEYNTIKNCYNVDGNHDDGIQCWAEGTISGDVENMIVRGNLIINTEDPNQPLQGALQGIGFFDGWHINFLIENNLIITNHWHGITILGAENSTIINNTVVNPWWLSGQSNLRTWIAIEEKKGGRLSTGNTIRNNIAHDFRTGGNLDLAFDHNLEVDTSSADLVYADWQNWDFHLSGDSPAVDAGTPVGAPSVDFDGNARPSGAAWDLGAFEYAAAPGPPVAYAGPDQQVADPDGDGFATVTLDGSWSFDPDGAIASHTWTEGSTTLGTGAVIQVDLTLGVHTITLTVANDDVPPVEATDTVVVTVAETVPIDSSLAWENFGYDLQSEPFAVEFDARPNAATVDAIMGFGLGEADWYSDMACIFRFYNNGRIEVRNGSAYTADVAVDYVADTWYHFRFVIDPTTHTYSVTVTPEGGAEIALATDYAFRTDQATLGQFDNWALVHTTDQGMSVDHVELGPPVQGPKVVAWEVVADHGPTGPVATSVTDGYTEPRLAGLAELRVTFSRAIDPATVQSGAVTIAGATNGDVSGMIQSLSLSDGDTVLTVALSAALPDQDTFTVTVTDLLRDTGGTAPSGDLSLVAHCLAGDADGSHEVDAADVIAIRDRSGQTLTPTMARYDLDGSGAITGADFLAARNHSDASSP